VEDERLRRAYEELARKTVDDRLAFADRVQEVLDEAQHLESAVEDRDAQIRSLAADAESLRDRVETLHEELQEAHGRLKSIEASRLYRLSRLIRRR
jgi:peptidoglycan hydrolase CwlO-like protein